MATTFNSINTPIKQEPHHSPPRPRPRPQPPPQQQPPPIIVKLEPQDLPIVVQERQQQPPPQEPQFLKSITELSTLSTAIDAFKRRFDELQNHLNFIDNAITTRSNELMEKRKQPQPQQQQQQTAAEKPASIPTPSEIVGTQQLPSQSQPETTKKVKETAAPTAAAAGEGKSEIRSLCEMMCGKGLRKYIISNLSNVDKLREELPLALKCSPKPAKLVLDCIGRFYLQGRKAYEKDSPMIAGREASILVLEAFLLISDGQNAMEAAVKEEAERAAVAWRRRLITEGGVRKSGEIDAKGLLFFIGGFGIPRLFSNEDVFDLVKLSNSKQFADVVRKSRVLVTKVSGILLSSFTTLFLN